MLSLICVFYFSVLSVDFINKANFTGRKIPKFDNIVKSAMFDEDTNINLPASMLTSPGLQGKRPEQSDILHYIQWYVV